MATRSLPERVSALEEAVTALQHLPQELAAFRTDVNARFDQVDAFRADVNARFERIDTRFDQIDARFAQVDARFDRVDARFERIDAQFERVYSQMRMLHEDLIDRIKALGERRDAGAPAPSLRPRPPKPKR